MIKFGWPSFNNKTEVSKSAEVAPAVKAETPEAGSNFKSSPLDELLGINFEPGAKVKVKRSSGQIEEDWQVSHEETDRENVVVTKKVDDQILRKIISRKHLREWNLPKRQEVASDKINVADRLKPGTPLSNLMNNKEN